MRFSLSTQLFVNAMNCSFFGTEKSFIALTNRFLFLYFEYTLKRLLGGFLFITQHRNSTCLDTKQYTVKQCLQ